MIKVILFFIVLMPGHPPQERTKDMPSFAACMEALNEISAPKFDPRFSGVVLMGCQIQHNGGEPT